MTALEQLMTAGLAAGAAANAGFYASSRLAFNAAVAVFCGLLCILQAIWAGG